jgi:hypothetical protein
VLCEPTPDALPDSSDRSWLPLEASQAASQRSSLNGSRAPSRPREAERFLVRGKMLVPRVRTHLDDVGRHQPTSASDALLRRLPRRDSLDDPKLRAQHLLDLEPLRH